MTEKEALRLVANKWKKKRIKPEQDPIGFAMEVDAAMGQPWGVSVKKRKQQIAKVERVIHDFYTDRWNDFYADQKEPGWAISHDVAVLLDQFIDIEGIEKHLRKTLKKISLMK